MIYRSISESSITIDTQFIFDKRLSPEAKLVLLILLTHDDSYEFSFEKIVSESKLSKYKVDKSLKELKDNKYLQYKQEHTAGRFGKVEWIIRENPNKAEANHSTYIQVDTNTEIISTSDYNFNRIWEAYPPEKRCSKKEARKAFNQIPDVNNLIEDILKGLNEMKGKEAWKKDGGRWIPGLARFLENRIWEVGLSNPTSAAAIKEKMMEVLKNAGY